MSSIQKCFIFFPGECSQAEVFQGRSRCEKKVEKFGPTNLHVSGWRALRAGRGRKQPFTFRKRHFIELSSVKVFNCVLNLTFQFSTKSNYSSGQVELSKRKENQESSVLVWPCMALYGLVWHCMISCSPCVVLQSRVWPCSQ